MDIRKRLHQYIDTGDEKLLKMMYAFAKEYSEEDVKYPFTAAEIAEFEERRNKRLSGVNKTYTWKEARAIIVGKKLPK